MMSCGISPRLGSWLVLSSIALASCGSTGEPLASSVAGEGDYPVVEASSTTRPEYPVAGDDIGDDIGDDTSEGTGYCIVDRFLFAGFIAGIESPRGLTIDRSVDA